MKTLVEFLLQIKFSHYLLLAIACALIWALGPYIAIAEHTPFVSIINRVLAIVALIVTVLVCARPTKQQRADAKQPSNIIEEKFASALQFLKANHAKNIHTGTKQRLADLPWYLVIGAKQTGKTSLLANSGLKFVLRKKETAIEPTQFFDVWATCDAVMLDVSGDYGIIDDGKGQAKQQWLQLLDLLKTHHRPSINGLVIAVSVEQLITQKKRAQNHLIKNIKQRINEVAQQLKQTFPVYIVLTHSDSLAGFNEFFDILSQRESGQSWGLSFSKKQIASKQSIADAFDMEFDSLLKRLNSRLINRLHQEHNQNRRALIKDFPLQMESLKKPLAVLLQQIAMVSHGSRYAKMRGIYFTSSNSEEEVIDRLMLPLKKSFALQTQVTPAQPKIMDSFFSRQLFQEVIFRDASMAKQLTLKQARVTHILQYASAATAVVLIASFVIAWTHQFAKNISAVSSAKQSLTEYNIMVDNFQGDKLADQLQALNKLATAYYAISQTKSPALYTKLSKQTETLQQTAQQAYYNAVQQVVKKQLQGILAGQLKGKSDTYVLYGASRNYMMLSDAQQFNAKYLHDWLVKYWRSNDELTASQLQQLRQHLAILFSQPLTPVAIDQQLAKQAQQRLRSTTISQLALAILNNDYAVAGDNKRLPIPQISHVANLFATDQEYLTVPAIYTAREFTNTYEQLIPKAVQTAMHGNNVIPARKQANPHYAMKQAINETRDLYFTNYIDTWQGIIDDLQLAPFNSIDHAIQVVDMLAQAYSPMTQLLQTIEQNTHVTYKNIQTPISIRFQVLHRLFNGNKQEVFLASRKNLNGLQDYLVQIANSTNSDQAAFEGVSKRLQQTNQQDVFTAIVKQANNAPAPLNLWLENTAQNSWQLMMNDSKRYIAKAWHKQVMPEYRNKIAKRYPFADSKRDVKFKDFKHFFAPDGTLDAFTKQYLQAFIHSDGNDWHWRQIDKHALSDNVLLLQQLQRAHAITEGFFDKNNNITVAFNVKSDMLLPVVKRITISLDDQHASFTRKSKQGANMIWPGNYPLHSATITVETNEDKSYSSTQTGNWAWLKALDKANVSKTSDLDKVNVNFDVHGYGARCLLTSTNPINPFNPALLHEFKLPQQLFS